MAHRLFNPQNKDHRPVGSPTGDPRVDSPTQITARAYNLIGVLRESSKRRLQRVRGLL